MESVVSNNDLKITNRNSNYINSKIDLLMQNLIKFYSKEKHINVLLPIVLGQSDISLRIIDWFVTNYCKKYKTIVDTFKDEIPVQIIVHLEYKNQLKAYSKKCFDPFCRQKRLIINTNTFKWREYNDDCISESEIVTTVGQLNFFRWFIDNKILDYALANIRLIDSDMITTMTFKKQGKRTVLSPSAVKGIYTNNCSITIKFKA